MVLIMVPPPSHVQDALSREIGADRCLLLSLAAHVERGIPLGDQAAASRERQVSLTEVQWTVTTFQTRVRAPRPHITPPPPIAGSNCVFAVQSVCMSRSRFESVSIALSAIPPGELGD